MLRRGFLKALVGAPIAAPVIAREATERAGIRAATMSGVPLSAPSATWGSGEAALYAPPIDRMRRDLRALLDGEARENYLRDFTIRHLDPDLASSKSLSLSAAMRIQRDREWIKYRDGKRSFLERALAEVTQAEKT